MFFCEVSRNPSGKKNGVQFSNVYLHSMYRSQTIEIWMVRPLSAVGKHCGYMLNTESCKCVHWTCVAFTFFPQLRSFLSTWGVIMNSLGMRLAILWHGRKTQNGTSWHLLRDHCRQLSQHIVNMLHVLAMSTIQGQCLLYLLLPIVQRLLKGGYYSKADSKWGNVIVTYFSYNINKHVHIRRLGEN